MMGSNKKRSRFQSKVPAGPSSKSPRKTPSSTEATAGPSVEVSSQTPKIPRKIPLDDHDEAMATYTSLVDAGRMFPDDALLSLIKMLPNKLRNWQDDDTDNALDSILPRVFIAIAGVKDDNDGVPESFLSYEEPHPNLGRFLKNVEVVKKGDPSFFKSLGEAIRGKNKELWRRVLMHGTLP
jgi:hypothetical protein